MIVVRMREVVVEMVMSDHLLNFNGIQSQKDFSIKSDAQRERKSKVETGSF